MQQQQHQQQSKIALLCTDSVRNPQPPDISLPLKPHQLASLHRLKKIDQYCGIDVENISTNIGIFADLAGYGKTITFLALLQELREYPMKWIPNLDTFSAEGYTISILKKRNLEDYINVKATLIVVPDNLQDHWCFHIEEYTKLHYELIDTDNYCKVKVEYTDLIVCPAKLYNKFIKEMNDICWNRVAFDEADSINIPNTEPIKTRFLWLITATFENINRRTNKGFLRKLFKASEFPQIVVKADDSFAKTSFNLVEPVEKRVYCKSPSIVTAINGNVSRNVLDLINAGDLDGAISTLGGNIDTDRNIIELVSRGIKNEMIVITGKLNSLLQLDIPETVKVEKERVYREKLASLQSRKETFIESINKISMTDCIICSELLREPTLIACCNNIFCSECIKKWAGESNTCPICRSEIQELHQIIITNENENETGTINNGIESGEKSKNEALVEIIKSRPSSKFIVFSGYSTTFKSVTGCLDHYGIKWGILTTYARTKTTLKRFRDGELSVILLAAEYNGAGIEIPQATDVVLYHKMSPALEIQTVARAQRPGRDSQLTVWKLLYPNE